MSIIWRVFKPACVGFSFNSHLLIKVRPKKKDCAILEHHKDHGKCTSQSQLTELNFKASFLYGIPILLCPYRIQTLQHVFFRHSIVSYFKIIFSNCSSCGFDGYSFFPLLMLSCSVSPHTFILSIHFSPFPTQHDTDGSQPCNGHLRWIIICNHICSLSHSSMLIQPEMFLPSPHISSFSPLLLSKHPFLHLNTEKSTPCMSRLLLRL